MQNNLNWSGGRHPYYHNRSKRDSGQIVAVCALLMAALAIALGVGALIGVIS